MKHVKIMLTALIGLTLVSTVSAQNNNVGIGTTSPDASAALDIESTTQGLLPPRMTEAQRNAISNPAAGLVIWCSDCGLDGELQVYGSNWTNMIGDIPASPIVPAVGDILGGGVVFWVDGSGGGLICAREEAFDPIFGGVRWHNGSNTATGATAKAIGTGQANTNLIVSIYGSPVDLVSYPGGYAAQACNDYSYGIYTDWFLPSEYELHKLWESKAIINPVLTSISGETLANAFYWSSSELSFSTARAYYMGSPAGTDPFYNNGNKSYGKSLVNDAAGGGPMRARPIRAF